MKIITQACRAIGFVLAAAVAAHSLSSYAQTPTETITHYHNDIAGSPLAATDAAGNAIWGESYQPYGARTLNSPASSGNKLWFHGKAVEDDSGLSYFGSRSYDPVLGRFMGVDAVGFDPAKLQTFNRYAYANNNPYRYVDPDGKSPLSVFLFEVAKQTGIGYVLGVGADAISQYAAFGQVDLYMAATSNAAIAGGEAGLLSGALSGAVRSWALAREASEIPKYARNQYSRVPEKTRKEVLEKDKTCVYCNENKSDTVDHVRSQKQDWVEGGWRDTKQVRSERVNDPSNLSGACRSCNSSKGDKPLGTGPGEWSRPTHGAE